MLIDLTQHATRCSDSSGQAQEYLIARHAAVKGNSTRPDMPGAWCTFRDMFPEGMLSDY